MRFNKEEFKIINEKIEAIYKCVNDEEINFLSHSLNEIII